MILFWHFSIDKVNLIFKGKNIYVHRCFIYNSQAMKCPSMYEEIKKVLCIYTVEYFSAIKKNGILTFLTT